MPLPFLPVFRGLVRCVLIAAALAFSVPPAIGQIPERFENLQILPKDITRAQLVQVMRGFTSSLGVRCQYCHVGEEGASLATFNFKTDEKPTKRSARVMMRMVEAINQTHLSQLDTIAHSHGGVSSTHVTERIEVQCVTCHRGQARPRMLESVIAGVIADSGVPAAVESYRALKSRYYGGYTFDFRERPLNAVAMNLMRENRPDDAVVILAVNLELNPDAASTHQLLGDAYTALGRRDSAIVSYRKSLELQPDNPPVKAKLEALDPQSR